MSASKTFNLAGLAASAIIIPDEKLRNSFTAARAGIMPQPDIMALAALEAAFRDGDEWLGQLLEYLQDNLEFLLDYFEKRIPSIRVIKPEGTYLVWLDCRGLGLDREELKTFFRKKAKLGLDDGYLFGPGGEGFQRMNIACPRSTLKRALQMLEQAVNELS
jgi:cystathionine beta-lyase